MPHTGAALRTTMDVNFAPTVGALAENGGLAATDKVFALTYQHLDVVTPAELLAMATVARVERHRASIVAVADCAAETAACDWNVRFGHR